MRPAIRAAGTAKVRDGMGLRGIVQTGLGKAELALERTVERVLPRASTVFVAIHAVRRHRRALGFTPNFVRPKTLSEKIVHRLVFDRRPILITLQDKYAVREYVTKRVGDHVLPRLYCATRNPAEIPFDEFPDRFVVKASHGCNWVYLVPDKARLDRQDLIATCWGWLRRNFYWDERDWAYKHIEPRILVEEYLSDGSGLVPVDYKFYVFHGLVHFIWACVGRFVDPRAAAYSRSWERLDVMTFWNPTETSVPRPPHLDEMVSCAETLAHGFDFLRVDMYDAGKAYFGEMTVYPSGGAEPHDPRWNRYLGTLWNLDKHRADRSASRLSPSDEAPIKPAVR